MHVFDNAGHNFDPLIKACGSPGKALQAVTEQAAKNFSPAVSTLPGTSIPAAYPVMVNGIEVFVKGVQVNGVFKLGTAYIP